MRAIKNEINVLDDTNNEIIKLFKTIGDDENIIYINESPINIQPKKTGRRADPNREQTPQSVYYTKHKAAAAEWTKTRYKTIKEDPIKYAALLQYYKNINIKKRTSLRPYVPRIRADMTEYEKKERRKVLRIENTTRKKSAQQQPPQVV